MWSNNKGFSILLVLVVSAIGALAVVSVMSLFGTTAENQKISTVRSSFISFVANLRSSLNDPHTCEILLNGQALGGNAAGAVNSSVVIGANVPGFFPGGPIQAGWVSPTKNFTVSNVEMTTKSAGAIRSVILDRPAPDLLTYQVRITFNIIVAGTTRQLFATTDPLDKFPEYQINLMVNVDQGTGLIYNCHGTSSMAEACELAGGAYDGSSTPTANAFPQYRCHPYRRCWVESGGMRTTPATTPPAVPVPPPLCPYPPSGSTAACCPWPYTTVSWIGQTTDNLWICQWCNNRLWDPYTGL